MTEDITEDRVLYGNILSQKLSQHKRNYPLPMSDRIRYSLVACWFIAAIAYGYTFFHPTYHMISW